MKKILVAEDEHITAILFKSIIERLGHEVIVMVDTGTEAVEQACRLKPDVAFLDINMEHRTAGIEACKSIKEKCPDIKVIFLTAYSANTFEKELTKVTYDGYIAKMDFESVAEELLE